MNAYAKITLLDKKKKKKGAKGGGNKTSVNIASVYTREKFSACSWKLLSNWRDF